MLEYKSPISLQEIMPVLDEHIAWYNKLMDYYFERRPVREPAPRIFHEWLQKARANKNIKDNLALRLLSVHEELNIAADIFTEALEDSKKVPVREFKELTRHYEEFIQMMRRIERDQDVRNSGFDEATGLRAVQLMEGDLAREMERRARQGNPFSLAIVKINNYNPEWERHEQEHVMMVKLIADQIRECLRSFDDAYYLGGEYFLLALKQADIVGSKAAVFRLNSSITVNRIKAPGEEKDVSVSTVVCEPTPGDSVQDLIKNLKTDLDGIEAKGTIVQFNDVSPLQRYIHSISKK